MAKRLNPTEKKREIVKLRGQGLSQQAVADAIDCSQKTVSRLENNDPEVKAAIKELQHGIITEGAPLAKEIVLTALSVGRRLWRRAERARQPGTVISDNKEALDLAQKNVKAVIQPAGLSAAPGQPFFLQQIYNDHRTQVDSEELESVKKFLDWKRDRDCAECEKREADESDHSSEPGQEFHGDEKTGK